MAGRDELARPALPHPEQHLELVCLGPERRHPHERLTEQMLVVGRNRNPGVTLDERLEAGDERTPHDLEILERDRSRLHVDPLAQPHARAQVAQLRDVGERTLEAGLQHDPHVFHPGAAEAAVEGEGVVHTGRVLHVDPDERAARSRITHETLE